MRAMNRIGKVSNMIRRGRFAIVILMLVVSLPGCSIYYESKRPKATDVTTIQPGTPRYDVTAVFGKPIESYRLNGKDVDLFQADPNGRNAGTKVAVTSFNAVADVLTIGMWEAVATPAELLTRHKLTTYVVTYMPQQTVESITTSDQTPKEVAQAAATPATATPALAAPTPTATQSAQPAGTSSATPAPSE